ncbi:hypothetical protein [Adlercreutzia shanghongiae]|uniref:Toxin n=1 Tax=Adlercreutzia shanghongiae TaxID=3111773 RepID=A0ABU6IVZ5_9ACTN|nr:hypothetical protein [Adlercreutzia sp. R22]MEC4293893.1 hypothetical protein [Adlercreutzia sp. R22]
MSQLRVHQHSRKHGLDNEDIIYAWYNFVRKRQRDDDCWVAIGFDRAGHEIELVGILLADGSTLIIHTLSPATEKIKRELKLKRS